MTSAILSDFKNYLMERSDFLAGYPVNLSYDYRDILPFIEFYLNNVGDPFIHSNYLINSRLFERETLAFFANLYQAKDWWGYVTTGGPEGNFYGLLLGRETYPDGILYATADSHYSINKAARFFKIPHTTVQSQTNGEMDCEDLRSKLNPNYPAIINLNIGTTFKGAVDNIDRILEALETKGIQNFHIHCDGAMGGMLLPYLAPEWVNFNQPIHSIAISGHKFIGCPFPCGIVLTYKELADKLASNIEYIGSKDMTIGGSRNGHAPLFLWYAIQKRKHLFETEARECVSKAAYLQLQLEKAGLSCSLNPYSTTVVFPKPQEATVQKWQLATLGNLAHVVVTQNHSYELLDRLIADILEMG